MTQTELLATFLSRPYSGCRPVGEWTKVEKCCHRSIYRHFLDLADRAKNGKSERTRTFSESLIQLQVLISAGLLPHQCLPDLSFKPGQSTP